MILKRLILFSTFLGLALGGIQPEFSEGSYKDLLVTISADVPEEKAEEIIGGIKVSLSNSGLNLDT